MSYYDHAVMMALRLGPWADPNAARPPVDHEDHGREQVRASKVRSPVAALLGAACRRLRNRQGRPDAAARPDGDVRQKT